VYAGSGFNGTFDQNQYTELYFKTSNNTSFQAGANNSGNFFGDGAAVRHTSHGGNSSSPTEFRILQASNTSYQVYASFNSFTGKSFYTISAELTSWNHDGTSTTQTPTTANPYIVVVPQIGGLTLTNISDQQLIFDKNGVLGGADGVKYDYSNKVLNVASTATFSEDVSSAKGIGYTENSVTRIAHPKGASYSGGSSVTGAIAIKLPELVYNSNTMMTIVVDVYEYETGNGARTLTIGGYNYQTGDWANVFASQESMSGLPPITVRFGQDATRNIIWLNETDYVWRYPKVSVRYVMCGHSNMQLTKWNDGWEIAAITAFDTVTQGPIAATIGVGENTDLRVDSLGVGVAAPGTSGNATINGLLTVNGSIKPSAGSGTTNGIIFPANPGLGSGDLASIQYYAIEGEKTVLELAVANDGQDSINLTATGGIGINQQTPAEALDVNGNIKTNGAVVIRNAAPTIRFQDSDSGAYTAFAHFNSNNFYILRNASTDATTWDSGPNNRHPMTLSLVTGNVTFSGDVTAFSDERLKKNIAVIDNGLTKVLTLKGVTFDHIESGRGTGLIAQDVLKVLPEAVHEQADGYLTLSYGNLVGLLVEAIKDLNIKVEQLEAKLNNNG
jgi:hypothetical protein